MLRRHRSPDRTCFQTHGRHDPPVLRTWHERPCPPVGRRATATDWYACAMTPHALTDAQWERVRRELPPQKPATGRPAKDHRTVVDAILWQRWSGRPWRE